MISNNESHKNKKHLIKTKQKALKDGKKLDEKKLTYSLLICAKYCIPFFNNSKCHTVEIIISNKMKIERYEASDLMNELFKIGYLTIGNRQGYYSLTKKGCDKIREYNKNKK